MSHWAARVALAKAEMALSRPEVPRRTDGWVYFIGAPFWPVVKIGWALNPNLRLDQIRLLSPMPLYLLGGAPGTLKDEKAVHSKFAALRNHGEWFRFRRAAGRFLRRN